VALAGCVEHPVPGLVRTIIVPPAPTFKLMGPESNWKVAFGTEAALPNPSMEMVGGAEQPAGAVCTRPLTLVTVTALVKTGAITPLFTKVDGPKPPTCILGHSGLRFATDVVLATVSGGLPVAAVL